MKLQDLQALQGTPWRMRICGTRGSHQSLQGALPKGWQYVTDGVRIRIPHRKMSRSRVRASQWKQPSWFQPLRQIAPTRQLAV